MLSNGQGRVNDANSDGRVKHGRHGTPTWRSWNAMRRRCRDENGNRFDRYGARGITVCDRWQDFAAFLEDLGEKPGPGYSLERIDNDRGYEPGNVRWATTKEQARNRRSSRMIEYNGQMMTMAQACEEAGLPYQRVLQRINKLGWSVEEALDDSSPRAYRKNRNA